MKIGYGRVSTTDQNADVQSTALREYGCERIYQESISGKDAKNCPDLQRMLDALRPGDVVVVQRLDRLARSLKDLIELLDRFKDQEISFVSLADNIDTTTATGELIFHLIGAIAQFEQRLVSERTKVGLAHAKARGRLGGRKLAMSDSDVRKANAMFLDPTVTKGEVARHFGVSRPTLNRALDRLTSLQES
ncbi:recombinase family protein [Photobacterium sagamiensis]|uniref:recombinase family protein n=1 Tax=Photobacterium sagamiensis TaxID=2910241 RepID=UPI003D0B7297